MHQLSLFAADNRPADHTDVAGLLAAHGQSTVGPDGASVSVVVGDRWRAEAIGAVLAEADLTPEIAGSSGGHSVATATTRRLAHLVREWRKGAVKSVPEDWAPTAGQLRLWALAAGVPVRPASYGLGIDAALELHAPQREVLLGALARAGMAAAFVRSRDHGPVLRISSEKRLRRLAETLGGRPDGVPAAMWPQPPTSPRGGTGHH